MLTAAITGLVILILGVAAKGLLASICIFVGAWLMKNSLVLMFLNSKYGKATIRVVKWVSYTWFGRFIGRLAFKVFALIEKVYGWVNAKIAHLIKTLRIKLWARLS